MGKHVLIVEDDELWPTPGGPGAGPTRVHAIRCGHIAEAFRFSAVCVDFGFSRHKGFGRADICLAKGVERTGVPFVFVSATDPTGVPPDLSGAPFLRKPVPPPRLLAVAARTCNNSGPPDGLIGPSQSDASMRIVAS